MITWEQRKLGDVAKVSVGIATSSSEYFTHSDSGTPLIKNENISDKGIDTKKLEKITAYFDQINWRKRVKAGDIVTVRTGYPGLSAVVPNRLNGAQTFTTLISRVSNEQVLPEFVTSFINSDLGTSQIRSMQAGGAQKNVNAKILMQLTVSLPSLNEQIIIKSLIKNWQALIAANERPDKNKHLWSCLPTEAHLRKNILTK